MNNPLNLPVILLPGPMPAGTIVSAAELAARRDQAAALEALHAAAREDAEALRRQAQAELEQARREAEALREAARQDAAAIRHQARDEAVDEAVQWLCCEQEMEQLIARELAQRWRTLTARVLDEVLGQSDQNQLLLRRVERKVAELLPRGRVTLCVSPSALAAATRAWASAPEVKVMADPGLATGQARLDNGLVRVHLDEPAHQARVLQQLAGEPGRVAHA
ncbi:protein EsaK [Chromobacterium sinusclupearum]|uniref:Protein EsaK n=1 Tax=Chromobacterium sinusclupearum TaxID=2077146 RepID=A0A2K4MRT1_9NEIS|nr:protein EsaK [Chromobacterium sinusclupearum]POA99796.1 protein EsaK [Chromobacterium sinusclupearum]